MADRLKTSRFIVSEQNECSYVGSNDNHEDGHSSLQQIINEEFNQRLKTCMRPDDLTDSALEHTPLPCNGNHNNASTNPIVVVTNGAAADGFVNKEFPSPDELTRHRSAKERFLADDDTCLLFTQTVVQSPMLTPTEETCDFLRTHFEQVERPNRDVNVEFLQHERNADEEVLKRIPEQSSPEEESNEEVPGRIPDLEEPHNKEVPTPEFVLQHKNDSPEHTSFSPSNLEQKTSDPTSPVQISNITPHQELQNYTHYQAQNVIEKSSPEEKHKSHKEQIKVEEFFQDNKLNDEELLCDAASASNTNINYINNTATSTTTSTTTITNNESNFTEARTDSNMLPTEKTQLKKKKSKKSKKDNEKENISVCDSNTNNTNDAIDSEQLSHISVKSLCRSFSDLTSLESKNNADNKFKSNFIKGRTKSMSDIRKDDINMDNVFKNVSVKNLKSSFSKFDALSKKTVLHVRSSDSAKAQETFNGASSQMDSSICKVCNRQVFQMEQIKAEKANWHKNCFRCIECSKQLNVDTYESNEGILYCKPHFKALFTPKAVEEEQTQVRAPRKYELIIRENEPMELPPDVVRASDKPDLGLEELQNLNVKERFQVFENYKSNESSMETQPATVNVKRSPSILSKLAKFQSKGMDVGIADDSLNGIPIEASSSEEEEEENEQDDLEGEDADLIRAKRAQREKPMHFHNMSDIKSKWETGNQVTKEERREERKQEIQLIRNRLFMGKQGKMKEMYQQAVAESESGGNIRKQLDTDVCEGARSIKEKFERGEVLTHDEQQKLNELDEDKSVFETGISRKSRSIFQELDANASKAPQVTAPLSPASGAEVRRAREAFMSRQSTSEDVVRSSDEPDAVQVRTADISDRFKFFETYKEPEKERRQFRITPPRDGAQLKPESHETEVYHDPEVVRSEDYVDDSQLAKKSHTATKMLSIFRQMEENLAKESVPAGPKPLKCFTPPPEAPRPEQSSSGEEDDDDEDEEDSGEEHVDAASRQMDSDWLEAQKAARAKQLRAKFEKWEANEIRREQQNNVTMSTEAVATDGDGQVESTRSLRARFESMRETNDKETRTPRVQVHRFV